MAVSHEPIAELTSRFPHQIAMTLFTFLWPTRVLCNHVSYTDLEMNKKMLPQLAHQYPEQRPYDR